jgi:transcriptional regulator with XRE-family HTH domain
MNVFKKKRLLAGFENVVETSEALGISASYLWQIESGYRKPGRDLIVKMCKLYKCKLEDIFFASDLRKSHSY